MKSHLRSWVFIFRHAESLQAALLLGVLAWGVFGRVLLRPQVMISGSDFVQFYFWEQFTRAQLALGQLPDWNPFFFAGYPFLANPQMRVFYPPAMFFRLFPLEYSFGLSLMFFVWWAGWGMYVLSRFHQLSRAASYVAAMTFMFSGVIVTHIRGGHFEWLSTIPWVPWVLWTWQRTLNGSWRWACLAGVVTAMMFLGGAARIGGVALLMVLGLGVYWLTMTLRQSTANWFPIIKRIGLGTLVAFGVAAPQLLPSLEFAALSSRASGLPLDCAASLSLTLNDLVFFGLARSPFDQFFEWERNGYVGAAAILLMVVGVMSTNRHKWLWIAWGVLGLSLSVGPVLPIYPLARELIPGLSVIRQPYTFVVMVTFALAGLAGLGLDHFREFPRQRYIALAGILLFVTLVFDVLLYQARPQPVDSSFYGWVSWLTSFSTPRYTLVLVSVVLLTQMARRRVGLAMLLGVLYLDLWFFSYSVIPVLGAPYTFGPVPRVNPLEARVLTVPYAFADRTMALGTANAQGYAPVVLKSYADFVSAMLPPARCPDLEHASIEPTDKALLKLLSVRVIDRNGVAENVASYYPRALWVGEAVTARTNEEAIKLARAAGFDPTRQVIVEGVPSSSSVGQGSAQIIQYGMHDLTLAVDATSEGWLYLNDVWYPGWQAWVNGQPTPVLRANGTFRAVRVPAGQSTVFMQYESTYLNLGISIAAVTWLLLGGIALWNWRRR